MTGKTNQVLFIPVLILSCLFLLAPPATADVFHDHVLDGHVDAFGGWTGSSSFNNGLGTIGSIDYAVFEAADFIANFAGAGYVPTGPMVYTYQVNVDTDSDHFVSAEIVGISNPVSDLVPGTFDLGGAGDVDADDAFFDGGGNATWLFQGVTGPVPIEESSWGLVFSSPQLPMNGASLTINGGTPAPTFLPVPTPGPSAIPEPTSIVLLAVGFGGLALSKRRRRRF